MEGIPPLTAELTGMEWEIALEAEDGCESVSNETGHCRNPEADHGLGAADSAVTEGVPDPKEPEVRLAGLAAAVAISADDGKSLEVVNEVGSADVLLENEVAMENMKLVLLSDVCLMSV